MSTITYRRAAHFGSLALVFSFLATACAVDATQGDGAPAVSAQTAAEATQGKLGSREGAAEGLQVIPTGPIGLCGGLTLCGEACADLQTDNNNCGSCGNVCHPFWVRHTFINIHCVDGECI